ncbi:hypothetical protein J6590_052095 [Homalodisca vitripennis]|nr:hypothetical protein J6590_052095 [Homalodisca vitripennis]
MDIFIEWAHDLITPEFGDVRIGLHSQSQSIVLKSFISIDLSVRADQVKAAKPVDRDTVCDNRLAYCTESLSIVLKSVISIDFDLSVRADQYNFDFRAEEPLEGNWVWERVEGPTGNDIQEVSANIPSPGAEHPAGASRQDA